MTHSLLSDLHGHGQLVHQGEVAVPESVHPGPLNLEIAQDAMKDSRECGRVPRLALVVWKQEQ